MRASQRARACVGVVALLLAVAGVGLLAPAASAATVTVTLGVQGPSPATVTITAGDTVVFRNGDQVTHTVKSKGANWSFSATIAAGRSASYVFTAAGTFDYTDTHGLLSTADTGHVIVNAAKPSPTPKPSATPKPTASPKPSATPKPTASPKPSATPTTASPTPDATVPPTQAPTSTPSQPTSQRPVVAAPPPVASPSTTPASVVTYAGRPLVQGSSHRYGLPAALALVAVTGVASLLLRLLLGEPAVRRRRTRLEASNES